MAEIWEQQENEDAATYIKFKTYLGLPYPRSYHKLAEICGVKLQTLYTYAWRHNWRERALAFDRSNQILADLSVSDAIVAYQTRVMSEEAADYGKLHDMWEDALQKVEEAIKENRPVSESVYSATEAISKLMKTREGLSVFARRTARMPKTYKPEVEQTEEDAERPWVIEGKVTKFELPAESDPTEPV